MSIQELSTDFKDDVLDTVANENRKYQMTYNTDGTVSFTDVTKYSQNGSLFGAKEVNEEREVINQLNKSLLDMSDGMPIFTGYKNVSTSYAPEEDGFFMVDYKATDSSTNIVITTYDTTVANMVVGSGISTSGSRVNYTIPCIKGHAYRTDRSLERGTIVCRFMPLHG